jgi:hypothetical protein
MIEEGMARLELGKDLSHAALKASYVGSEQLRCSAVKALSPSAIIDSGNVDVVG